MPLGFDEIAETSAWSERATSWISDRVSERGHRLLTPIETVRTRPWSVLWRIHTDDGSWWFKANCASMQFEAALHAGLAGIAPHRVVAPIAVSRSDGWILTRDHGPTLADAGNGTTDDWCRVLSDCAALQRELIDHADVLLASGMVDASPPTVLDRFDDLLDRFARLPADHPSRLDEPTRHALEEVRPAIERAADTLAAGPLPPSLQHGDLHPGNVFADRRVFDFGDAQWAHPFEVLRIPYAWALESDTLDWTVVEQAYLEPWFDLVDPRTANTLVQAAAFTHAVNRCLTWADCLEGLSLESEPLRIWGEAPLLHLKGVLDA